MLARTHAATMIEAPAKYVVWRRIIVPCTQHLCENAARRKRTPEHFGATDRNRPEAGSWSPQGLQRHFFGSILSGPIPSYPGPFLANSLVMAREAIRNHGVQVFARYWLPGHSEQALPAPRSRSALHVSIPGTPLLGRSHAHPSAGEQSQPQSLRRALRPFHQERVPRQARAPR
jgi:hypothetical protein